jgi:hypothetical protein
MPLQLGQITLAHYESCCFYQTGSSHAQSMISSNPTLKSQFWNILEVFPGKLLISILGVAFLFLVSYWILLQFVTTKKQNSLVTLHYLPLLLTPLAILYKMVLGLY